MKTTLGVKGDKLLINGRPVYAEIPGANPASLGLLWNQRMIQGVFDDKAPDSPSRMAGFDPERGTDALIAALPAWHSYAFGRSPWASRAAGPSASVM